MILMGIMVRESAGYRLVFVSYYIGSLPDLLTDSVP